MSAVAFEHVPEQFIRIVVVVAVVVNLGAVYKSVKLFMAFPVVLHRCKQFRTGTALLIKHELPDRSQAVRAGCHAAGLRAGAVILGSAFRQVPARFHAVLIKCGYVRYRL